MKEAGLAKKPLVKGLLTKVIVVTLIISLAIMPGSLSWLGEYGEWSLGLAQASAATTSTMSAAERVGISFTDMNDNHWAARQIRELQMRGVLMGFADGTFRPDKGLKKIEGLVMAVRILGLDYQASTKTFEKYHELNVYDSLGLSWAKGYLELAYEQGLITRYSEEIDWYADADRLWMAKIFTKVLGKEKEAQANNSRDLYYKDVGQVPVAMRGYIYQMFTTSLMEGYPDQTFRPNAIMTRAEIAALFIKYLDKYVKDYSYESASNLRVEEVDLARGRLVVRETGYDLRVLQIHQNTMVWEQGTNSTVRRQQSALRAGDLINAYIYDDYALLIDIVGDGYSTPGTNVGDNTLPGQVTEANNYKDAGYLRAISDHIPFLSFDNVFGGKGNYYLADNVAIYDGGRRLNRSDLKRDQLYIYEVELGKIVRMDVVAAYDDSAKGVVVSYSTYTKGLTIRLNSGTLVTLDVPESLGEGLHLNDMILAKSYNGMLLDMDILSYSYIEGWFESYDSDKKQITVRQGSVKYTFKVSDTVRLSMPGNAYAKLTDLRRNNYVQLSFAYLVPDDRGREPDIVANIYVLTAVKEETTKVLSQGTIYELRGDELIMDSWYGSMQVYQLTDKTVIKDAGKEIDEKARERLVTGQDISFYYEGDKIAEINLMRNGQIQGYLQGYSSDRRIWLVTDRDYRLEFRLSDLLAERFEKNANKDLQTLLGQFVNVQVTKSEVTSIATIYYGTNVQKDIKVWTYDQAQNLLWVRDENYFYIYRMHPGFFDAGYSPPNMSIPRLKKLMENAWERVDVGTINGVVISME